jgi:hypothetical protein
LRVADFNRRLRFSLTPEHVLYPYAIPPRHLPPRWCPRIIQESGAAKEADGVVHARQGGLGNLVRPICVHREHPIQFGGIGQQFERAGTNRLKLGDNGVGHGPFEVAVPFPREFLFLAVNRRSAEEGENSEKV